MTSPRHLTSPRHHNLARRSSGGRHVPLTRRTRHVAHVARNTGRVYLFTKPAQPARRINIINLQDGRRLPPTGRTGEAAGRLDEAPLLLVVLQVQGSAGCDALQRAGQLRRDAAGRRLCCSRQTGRQRSAVSRVSKASGSEASAGRQGQRGVSVSGQQGVRVSVSRASAVLQRCKE